MSVKPFNDDAGDPVIRDRSSTTVKMSDAERPSKIAASWPDIIGVLWVLIAGLVALAPALIHGHALGPYDYLSGFGLTEQKGVIPRNPATSDQISQMIPWTALNWTQVHRGVLPLWNPFSGLGMPQAFNWQSAPFSIPSLVGYAVPMAWAYTVGLLTTLIVAGTGAYVFARTLGLGVLAAALAGTTFELGGTFFGWLGWPFASVLSWSGWLLAAALLILRGRNRVRSVVLFALVAAAAVFAGQPDALILLLLLVGAFVVAVLVFDGKFAGGPGTRLTALVDLVAAGIAGAFLAAPLLLPGFQLLSKSVRNGGGSTFGAQLALSPRVFVSIFVGYSGIPIAVFAPVGAIVVVLAVTGAIVRWRSTVVRALVLVTVALGAVTFIQPVISLLNDVPGLHAVRFPRMVTCVLFCVCVLAAVGMDVIVKREAATLARKCLGIGFGVASVGFVACVTAGVASAPRVSSVFVSTASAGFKARSIWWGIAGIAVGLGSWLILFLAGRFSSRNHNSERLSKRLTVVVCSALLVVESGTLIAAAAPILASADQPISEPAPVVQLRNTVSTSVVGLGPAAAFCLSHQSIGLLPNTNVLWGLRQFAVYDPMLPSAYFSAWRTATGRPGGVSAVSTFCPAVTSSDVALRFGIGFVLEAQGVPGPMGSEFVRHIGNEDLYRIRGASAATLTTLTAHGDLPDDSALGIPVGVSHPKPSIWRIATSSASASVLRLHLTDVPGWHATLDGRPLRLVPYSGLMLQARIPAGRHVVVVAYWPETFTLGLAMAAIALVSLGVAGAIAISRRRRIRAASTSDPGR